MVAGSAMAPTPTSPHASFFSIGGIMFSYDPIRSAHNFSCFSVSGLAHISVFIAGARIRGREWSQARTMLVSRLSQMPFDTFASVLADRGAMRNAAAHFRSSMCSTASPTPFQEAHSSRSRKTTAGSKPSMVSRKFSADSVATTRTLYRSLRASYRIFALMAATLPVTPSSTLALAGSSRGAAASRCGTLHCAVSPESMPTGSPASVGAALAVRRREFCSAAA
mmetsp:Transcript_10379/g.28311  ORF Transcript_10379/g.28311 Transcript_10379/m.28311 type:complete len:223 (+) Transcript_10379:1265-1933(+)